MLAIAHPAVAGSSGMPAIAHPAVLDTTSGQQTHGFIGCFVKLEVVVCDRGGRCCGCDVGGGCGGSLSMLVVVMPVLPSKLTTTAVGIVETGPVDRFAS